MSAGDRRRIEECGAVLGHVERTLAIALLDPQQYVGEAPRVDLPPRLGVGGLPLPHRGRPHRPGSRVGAYDAARVVVDAEKVERLSDEIEVGLRPARPGAAEDLLELRRIAAEEHGVEIL